MIRRDDRSQVHVERLYPIAHRLTRAVHRNDAATSTSRPVAGRNRRSSEQTCRTPCAEEDAESRRKPSRYLSGVVDSGRERRGGAACRCLDACRQDRLAESPIGGPSSSGARPAFGPLSRARHLRRASSFFLPSTLRYETCGGSWARKRTCCDDQTKHPVRCPLLNQRCDGCQGRSTPTRSRNACFTFCQRSRGRRRSRGAPPPSR